MAGAYKITQIVLPAGQWTPVSAPFNCSYFSFKSQGSLAIRLRTDPNDATTEDILPGGYQEVTSTVPFAQNPRARFVANEVLFYAQPASGSDVGILKYG